MKSALDVLLEDNRFVLHSISMNPDTEKMFRAYLEKNNLLKPFSIYTLLVGAPLYISEHIPKGKVALVCSLNDKPHIEVLEISSDD